MHHNKVLSNGGGLLKTRAESEEKFLALLLDVQDHYCRHSTRLDGDLKRKGLSLIELTLLNVGTVDWFKFCWEKNIRNLLYS